MASTEVDRWRLGGQHLRALHTFTEDGKGQMMRLFRLESYPLIPTTPGPSAPAEKDGGREVMRGITPPKAGSGFESALSREDDWSSQ